MAFLGMRPHLARPLICFTVKGGLIDREQRSNYAEYTTLKWTASCEMKSLIIQNNKGLFCDKRNVIGHLDAMIYAEIWIS